ncbi:MAG: class I SAM-dependent methyltransferase [Candidatus Moranbacteria bacterium]|nr:class I SAM-dependent methyltransferase [Candidatus Moranbacteria bacterium]
MLKNIVDSEILKNPLDILASKDILAVLKKHWVANHENLIDPEKFVEAFFAEIKNLGSNREINKLYQKKLKEFRDDSLDLGKPGDMFLEMIEEDLRGVETMLDFGCGKLAFLKNMAEKNLEIKKLIGIDLKSQPVLNGLDTRIEFHRSLSEIVDASVDLVTIKLVLHHLKSEQESQGIFAELRRVLKADGKLIVFEESFPETNCEVEEIEKYLAKFNLQMSEVTADFLQLSPEDKIKFLFINDWLMNLQNTYMPWTMQYKSIERWQNLIVSVGFTEKESHFLGAIKHRKRKQGMTAELIFKI